VQMPGFHAARLQGSGLIIVRYAVELPGERFRLLAVNPEYEPLSERDASLLGRVRQSGVNGNDEHWELISPVMDATILLNWLLEALTV
jgi:hypothetical protein